MGNRKNKALIIAFISMLTLTAGCGVTITRNHYYAYPKQSTDKSNTADTLINNKNDES